MSRLGLAAALLLVCGTVFALIIPDHTMELQWNANEILKFWLALIGTIALCYGLLERAHQGVKTLPCPPGTTVVPQVNAPPVTLASE